MVTVHSFLFYTEFVLSILLKANTIGGASRVNDPDEGIRDWMLAIEAKRREEHPTGLMNILKYPNKREMV